MTKVLVVGKGGREHALLWKLAQSRHVEKLYVAPGRDACGALAKVVPTSETSFSDLGELVMQEGIDMTVIGPEEPLADGIVDYWREHLPKHAIFGPSQSAARLEGSKLFAKRFMDRHDIPTAPFEVFSSTRPALTYARELGRCVVKADGLASGKGSIVCRTYEDAHVAIKRIIVDKEFGSAGDQVVIEEFMPGEEASILAVTDGETYRILVPSQDHKPLYKGGPNTGGMGVQMTSFIAVLGAAGLAVGLALQGSLSNFAGGVLILLFKPFTVGDYITAQGHSGTVDEIQVFNTVLKTPDNKTIIIPNGKLSNDSVVNYSTEPTRRIEMVFGISYDDNIKKAKKILEKIVSGDERILEEPTSQVVVGELADNSINFKVRVWCRKEDYWGIFFDMQERVKEEFDKAKITIPYPQQDVHVKK